MVWDGSTRERLNRQAVEKAIAYKKAVSEIIYEELKENSQPLKREDVERAVRLALNRVQK